ncbi:MAG: sulfoxide reductase heme-binding subunit YedZ [Nitrospirae bacterium]|nr:sulfoxide reductase heme-binding subunit YedZ [Nitrospirota bacterium]
MHTKNLQNYNVYVSKKTYINILAICVGLIPTLWLIWLAIHSELGAEPIKKIIHTTGEWGLNFVVLALALRAFKKVPDNIWINMIHRIVGIFAYYYISLHFITYIALEQFFDFNEILQDVSKHRRIIIGFIGYLLLSSVAITSIKNVTDKIGYQMWKKVHGLAYFVPICGVIHYLWLVKKDIRIPLVYAFIVAFLIVFKRFLNSNKLSK